MYHLAPAKGLSTWVPGVGVGVVVGVVVGVDVGVEVGVEVGVVVGVEVGVEVEVGVGVVAGDPLQATPFSVKFVGVVLLFVNAPLKPMTVGELGAKELFQSKFFAVTLEPDCAQVALHPCVTV